MLLGNFILNIINNSNHNKYIQFCTEIQNILCLFINKSNIINIVSILKNSTMKIVL